MKILSVLKRWILEVQWLWPMIPEVMRRGYEGVHLGLDIGILCKSMCFCKWRFLGQIHYSCVESSRIHSLVINILVRFDIKVNHASILLLCSIWNILPKRKCFCLTAPRSGINQHTLQLTSHRPYSKSLVVSFLQHRYWTFIPIHHWVEVIKGSSA